MTVYSTKDFLGQWSPPVFEHDGARWQGVYLSAPQWMQLVPLIDHAMSGREITVVELNAAHRILIDTLFPPPARPMIAVPRGWLARLFRRPARQVPDLSVPAMPTAGEVFTTLPLVVQRDMIVSFLVAQANALGLALQQPAPRDPTPAATETPASTQRDSIAADAPTAS